MADIPGESPYPFEIHHGPNVIKIDDDWSGHVLVEQIYDGLRRARQSRDTGHVPLPVPASGSQAENMMIETAMFYGFRPIDGMATFQATSNQIVALMMAALEQGRFEALQEARTAGSKSCPATT
ncbi:hypothetical protein [Methylorubrum aminovorans]